VRTSANDTQRPSESSRPALPTWPLEARPAQCVHHEMGPRPAGPHGVLAGASEDEPYCSHMVTGIGVILEGDAVKCQAWVSAITTFTHGQFAPAEYAAREKRFGGVEIALETWCGPEKGWDYDQKIRVSSDTARRGATVVPTLPVCAHRAASVHGGAFLTRVNRWGGDDSSPGMAAISVRAAPDGDRRPARGRP
jgi:hypothetical protein